MTTFRQKLHPHVLIPWVLALVALFGCNVLAQPKASLRKSAHLDGGSVTQLADEGAPSTAPSTFLLGLTNGAFDGVSLNAPSPQRIGIGARSGQVEIALRGGVVQGRAPPVTVSC